MEFPTLVELLLNHLPNFPQIIFRTLVPLLMRLPPPFLSVSPVFACPFLTPGYWSDSVVDPSSWSPRWVWPLACSSPVWSHDGFTKEVLSWVWCPSFASYYTCAVPCWVCSPFRGPWLPNYFRLIFVALPILSRIQWPTYWCSSLLKVIGKYSFFFRYIVWCAN